MNLLGVKAQVVELEIEKVSEENRLAIIYLTLNSKPHHLIEFLP